MPEAQSTRKFIVSLSLDNTQDGVPPLTREDFVVSFLVRVGIHGHIGRFHCEEGMEFKRADRVLCRTERGLEVGQIMTKTRTEWERCDGTLIRRMNSEDELLWGHLQALGGQARESCQKWIDTHGSGETLLEVEPLMDGRTLYFHFLSEVDDSVQEHVDELAKLFEEEVQKSEFAQRLDQGCGPGCGTEAAQNGCGTAGGGCAVCSIASACKKQ